jgi:predicted dehydrogenase
MDRKYRVAVVGGAGTWGRQYLRAYTRHPDCEVIGLVDRAGDRRQMFADQYGIKKVYNGLEDLLAEDLPDIVSAVIPVESNPETVIACAEAGVKVISCEKPMAVTLSDADAMVRICRERGSVFSCGSVYADVPGHSDALDRVRAGFLGRITRAVIPGGLPREMAGGGCVPLTLLRLLTRQGII